MIFVIDYVIEFAINLITLITQSLTRLFKRTCYCVFTEFYHHTSAMENSCNTFLTIAAILGCLLFLSAFAMCWLATRLHTAVVGNVSEKSIDRLVRDHSRRFSSTGRDNTGYTGRATTQ